MKVPPRPRLPLLLLPLAVSLACGPGSPGGPDINRRVSTKQELAGPSIQSNDILARSARANRVRVQHILVSWKERSSDPRGEARSREEADELAVSLLERVRAGEPIEPLMKEHSEDPGSAATGSDYEVSPSAEMVFEFKRLALRLEPDEAGLVLSEFGWHVMKRVE